LSNRERTGEGKKEKKKKGPRRRGKNCESHRSTVFSYFLYLRYVGLGGEREKGRREHHDRRRLRKVENWDTSLAVLSVNREGEGKKGKRGEGWATGNRLLVRLSYIGHGKGRKKGTEG